MSMRSQYRVQSAAAMICSFLLLLALSAAAILTLAMWLEARATTISAPALIPAAEGGWVEVILLREEHTWVVESVGPLGHNQSFDISDRARAAVLFTLSHQLRGSGRPWQQSWTIGPLQTPPEARTSIPRPPTLDPRERWLLARSGLATAIRAGEIQWPAELATTATATRYSPTAHLQSGLESRPWLLVCLAPPLVFAGVRIGRHRTRKLRNLCHSCGYPRIGLPAAATCPECGKFPPHLKCAR